MNTPTTWVLVGNASEAKLFESQNIGRELNLLKSFSHPESREKREELVSDREGRYQANNGQGQGTFVEPSDPKVVEVEKFSRELAHFLETGRTANKFERLIIIMPPHTHGLLKKEINEQLKNMVIHHIEKDYTKMQERELISFLDDLARF